MKIPRFFLVAAASAFLAPLAQAVEAPAAPPAASHLATPAASPAPYSSAKWEKEIAAYEQADRESPPKPGGILFIGSSSIRLWKTLAEDFPGYNVLNRGFGGSRIADSVTFIPRIVLPYRPRQIFFYAGGNDLNAGETPQKIFGDFVRFTETVHASLPETQICFISSAPNHKRWAQVENVRELNRLVAEHCTRNSSYLRFVDVFPLMLGADGKPLPDIFVQDGLHMNPKGYAIWTAHIRPLLAPEK